MEFGEVVGLENLLTNFLSLRQTKAFDGGTRLVAHVGLRTGSRHG
jgi:hypothetical protein